MFIRDSVFEASRGLGHDADLQVVRYFEKSEMDKQAVTEKIKSKMNDHYKLTSSICGLRYCTKGRLSSLGAFNHKTVGTSFAQDDSEMNVMRIAWICYHSPNQTYERALDQNFAAWTENKIMTEMNVTYDTDTEAHGKKSACVLQLISNEMNHSRTRIFELAKNETKTRITLSVPVQLRKERHNRSRKSKSIYYIKHNKEKEYKEVNDIAT